MIVNKFIDDIYVVYSDGLIYHYFHFQLLLWSVLSDDGFIIYIWYKNLSFADVGCLSLKEMNMIEVQFIFKMDFKFNVTPDDFNQYSSFMESQMQFENPSINDYLLRTQLVFPFSAEEEFE
ncbi:hypothetical protein ZOSMA_321G00050 [Zostera marina]|uniref:Uncharacterized protein n=1 Tax=Zostera marina TaxID=29655 RepID=A0A0K9P8Q1_ZOSMR|nr:hypothetical protein ZOSMA_321G00050 [Zostera marina]